MKAKTSGNKAEQYFMKMMGMYGFEIIQLHIPSRFIFPKKKLDDSSKKKTFPSLIAVGKAEIDFVAVLRRKGLAAAIELKSVKTNTFSFKSKLRDEQMLKIKAYHDNGVFSCLVVYFSEFDTWSLVLGDKMFSVTKTSIDDSCKIAELSSKLAKLMEEYYV